MKQNCAPLSAYGRNLTYPFTLLRQLRSHIDAKNPSGDGFPLPSESTSVLEATIVANFNESSEPLSKYLI